MSDLPSDQPKSVQAAGSASGTAPAPAARVSNRLFSKYVALFVAVVWSRCSANGIFDVWFYYQEHKASLIRIQREQAEAAAAKIGQFIKEIESQLGWTTQLPWSAGSIEQRRFDALRLLRQVPAITELAQLDATRQGALAGLAARHGRGRQRHRLSKDPKFTEAVAHKVYYGPVYFRRESEPYMTLALAGTRRDAGVSVAEVNLKLIWDVVSQIKVGEHGHAYVVDAQGRLIAHPDISLVLRNTDMSHLAQVKAARAGPPASPPSRYRKRRTSKDARSSTAYAPVPPLGWLVFVELPAEEAYAPLYAALQRLAFVLLAALCFAVLAGMFLARRMVGPIQALRAGRRAHRQRRSRPAHLDQDRRRAGRACRPVQRHGRAAAGILCRSGTEGRGAHARAGAVGRRAARARRSHPGGQLDPRSRDRARPPSSPRRSALRHRRRRHLRLGSGNRQNSICARPTA